VVVSASFVHPYRRSRCPVRIHTNTTACSWPSCAVQRERQWGDDSSAPCATRTSGGQRCVTLSSRNLTGRCFHFFAATPTRYDRRAERKVSLAASSQQGTCSRTEAAFHLSLKERSVISSITKFQAWLSCNWRLLRPKFYDTPHKLFLLASSPFPKLRPPGIHAEPSDYKNKRPMNDIVAILCPSPPPIVEFSNPSLTWCNKYCLQVEDPSDSAQARCLSPMDERQQCKCRSSFEAASKQPRSSPLAARCVQIS
jgi:hypothetical protein